MKKKLLSKRSSSQLFKSLVSEMYDQRYSSIHGEDARMVDPHDDLAYEAYKYFESRLPKSMIASLVWSAVTRLSRRSHPVNEEMYAVIKEQCMAHVESVIDVALSGIRGSQIESGYHGPETE